jgi:transketolase
VNQKPNTGSPRGRPVIGSDGIFIGMMRFGASAPYKELYQHFGITPEKVAAATQNKLG